MMEALLVSAFSIINIGRFIIFSVPFFQSSEVPIFVANSFSVSHVKDRIIADGYKFLLNVDNQQKE